MTDTLPTIAANNDIAGRLQAVRATVPPGVDIIAVSKFHPVEALRQAYDAGQRLFGESRQQELLQKIPQLPDDIRWHFIGHLQTNKVRTIVGKVAMIESVDTVKLLSLIDAESRKAGVVTNVLMQVHVAMEETKYGFYPDELVDFFATGAYREFTGVNFRGIMGMASNTDDTARIRADFEKIAATHHQIQHLSPGLNTFTEISMGMSHDYGIAIECGATLVRIGTAIFGER